jgi:(2R)-3-sulfolactate dehydrogenase (NADP+)
MADAIMQVDGARVPGARRHEMRARLRRDGISVDSVLLNEIKQIAAL